MAVVLGAFVPDTAARWRSVVKGEVAQELGVAAAARKLAARLERVAAALADAEARGDEATARWLAEVRAAAFEADAAVDRCRVTVRRLRSREPKHQQQQQQPQAVPWLLSSCCDDAEPHPHDDIAADLKSVNRKLRAILRKQRRLQLHAAYTPDLTVHTRTLLRRQPTDPDIIGTRMQDDARLLVNRLTTQPNSPAEVITIVGPDGIGKTRLAKMVYESARVRCSFESTSWVRLGRRYTEAGLLSQVIDAFGGDTEGGESVADLKAMLTGLVANKRFLLVVDDVWYGGVWEDVLQSPLERGGRGSKVLVTARRGSIAREMGAGLVHRMKRLSADDGWLLLRTAACVASHESQLKGVGERLVDKCGGIPLAIKAVAGVLRTRAASVDEWGELLASPAWSVKGLPDDAMTALYLCYDDLPCHLKQCFLYCSLFPPGLAVQRAVIMQHWIAERLVQARSGASVEEVAEEYYDELVGRNLLQTTEQDVRGRAERCTMHEMLHALSRLLLQGEGFTGDVDVSSKPPTRHTFLPGRNMAAIPERILNLEGVRTLLLPKNPLTTQGNIFTRLHHQLRVLDLSETGIELIPETLGDLVHLRFLNLSRTGIQAVPESIGNLWSLKFLLLRECKSLHALPKGIHHLRGLRDLDIAGTTVHAGTFRVGQLRSLTSLRCFAVTSKEDRGEWPLAEIKHLCQLRILHVHKLENVPGRSEAVEAALASKMRLRELALSCSSGNASLESQTPTAVRKIEDVLEELNPPPCLKSLKIASYFGAKFPSWLSPISLPNLRHLDIIGCSLCKSFPPLGQLPQLRSLYIADCSALTSIDAELNHPEVVPFPKLENLRLQGLHKLQTWTWALPSLKAIQLESCPQLRRLPGGLRHVVELRIVDMASLEAVEDMPALRELSVWNAPNLNKVSSMPSLEDLSISHCPVLQIVDNVNKLRAVHIFDHQLQEIPRWIEALAAKLRSLDVTSTIKLLKRCLVDGPDWPLIKDIVQVHGLTTGSGDYIYYSKSPYIFDSNFETAASDDASAENRNVNQDTGVAASGTGYMNISGFFDSKAVNEEAPTAQGNVTHRNAERKNSRRRMHKLARIVPEDGEAEEDADSVVMFHAHPTKAHSHVEKLLPVVNDDRSANNDTGLLSKGTPQETGPDATRQTKSKMGKDVPADADAGGSSIDKSATAVGLNLVREGFINSTETDQNSNISLLQGEEYTLNKGDNFANISKQTTRVHDIASKVPKQVVHSDSKDKTQNSSPAIMARSRQVTFNIRKDDHAEAAIHSPNTINQKNVDKIKEAATSAVASTNAITMPEIPAGREVAPKSARTIDGSLIHESHHHTVSITKDSTCTAVDNIGDHMEERSISLPANPNHEESKAFSATETMSDSEPSMVPTSLDWRKQQAPKRQEASFAGAGASTKKIPRMASKILEKVTYKSKTEAVGDPSNEASKNSNPQPNPACTPCSPIGTTEATIEAKATMTYRHHTSSNADDNNAHFSIDVKADDSHQAPKVYTAIWADTDTDTLRARFLSSMQQYRSMASRRRHRRHRAKHGSGNAWSIGPVLVVILLVVSVTQLLFIIWLYRRLLNQK